MPDEKPPAATSHMDEVLIGAIVFGVVVAVVLWVLTEHEDAASNLLNLGIGKITTWVQ